MRRHDADDPCPPRPVSSGGCCARKATCTCPACATGFRRARKLPEPLRARWTEATGTAVHEALGMSECSTFLSGGPRPRPAPEGTLGYAQEGRRLAVLDEDGTELPADENRDAGRPPQRSGADAGLLDRVGARRNCRFAVTGSRTGDRVLRKGPTAPSSITDGANDLITAGGFRIAPQEIEAVFHGAPGVDDCAALAISPRPDTNAHRASPMPVSPRRRHLRNWRRPRLAR